jgi:hypothetical protein
MAVMIGFVAGAMIGIALSTSLFRLYLRRHLRDRSTETTESTQTATESVETDGVSIPREMLEQLQVQLRRLEVLERREAMRVVRRESRQQPITR